MTECRFQRSGSPRACGTDREQQSEDQAGGGRKVGEVAAGAGHRLGSIEIGDGKREQAGPPASSDLWALLFSSSSIPQRPRASATAAASALRQPVA